MTDTQLAKAKDFDEMIDLENETVTLPGGDVVTFTFLNDLDWAIKTAEQKQYEKHYPKVLKKC